MRIKILIIGVVLAGLLFSLAASAQISCNCANPQKIEEECFYLPEDQSLDNDLDGIISIPKFNSELGCLQSVKLTATSSGYIFAEVDSESKLDRTWELLATSGINVTIPGLAVIVAQFGTVDGRVPVTTGPDDEVGRPDFSGTDYGRLDYGSEDDPIESDPVTNVITDETQKQLFIGSEGETLAVPVASSGRSNPGGPSSDVGFFSFSEMNAKVCVEYTYCPLACIIGSKVGCDDEPLSDWTITLTKPDGSTDTRVTDADGQYSFCNLPPGSYDVCEETRPGWYPVGPNCYNDIILGGQDVYVPAFKNTEHFCISGYKYNVTPGGDEPLAGWTITLTKPDGSTVIDSTDDNGYYEFCDLPNGQYQVCEELKSGWTAKSPICIPVNLYCEDSEDNNFRNAKEIKKLVCVCPFFIKNDLYGANSRDIKVVDASKGILYNDPAGSVVLNPESITIDPKYGTIEVHEDGSFVYDPTGATGLYPGIYVMFKYTANNGLCDSKYPGIAKIQIRG